MKLQNFVAFLVFVIMCVPNVDAQKTSKPKPNPWTMTPDPALPNVLILGDSISIGYTLAVRSHLEGKANVFRPMTPRKTGPLNCQGTTLGIEKVDSWLKEQKWDVIHFNWGLHDLKHVHPETGKNSMSFDDPRQAEPDDYRKNLTAIVSKLKASGAKLIFATTTPYPNGVRPARLPADAKLYNDIALKIMKEHKIAINDLYALTQDRLEILQNPVNVHFNKNGNVVLAEKVAQTIAKALKKSE